MTGTTPMTTPERPDVSIVYTNWNTRDMMRDCIASVKEKSEGFTYEIIVVDDGSTDGSVDMLRSEFPEVVVLENGKNIGVAKSYNKGVAVARGRYVQMLNTDMLMIHNAIRVLMDFLEAHPEAAACVGRLRNRDMTSQVSYGYFPSFTEALARALFLHRIFPRAHLPHPGIIPPEDVTEPFEAEYLSGADMLIRKSVIDTLGFFDERFTSYCEETDFCYRILHETPYKLYVVPSAEIIHFGGASFAHVSEYRIRLQYSSYDKFLTKHHGKPYALVTRGLYAFQYGVRAVHRGVVALVAPSERARTEAREAFWHMRYALFPTERRP